MSDQNIVATLEQARGAFNRGDIQEYLQVLYTPDAILHYLPPGLPQGHSGGELFYGQFLAAFPDANLVFDDMVQEADRIAIRFHVNMTHKGEFNGIPATNKAVTMSGITTMRFADGKCVERWSESDFVGLLTQLGAISAP